jgi:hypothetical protein
MENISSKSYKYAIVSDIIAWLAQNAIENNFEFLYDGMPGL